MGIESFEEKLKYRFKDPALLKTALTHSSYAHERSSHGCADNERLEFLGDAVLETIISLELFKRFTDKPEGELTKMRAALVCERSLSSAGIAIGLNDHLLLGKGEELGGGRNRASIIADAAEALIAAVYLDGGFEAASRVVSDLLGASIDRAAQGGLIKDSKSELQEILQKNSGCRIEYRIVSESGPDHDKRFDAEVLADGKLLGTGSGKSKKEAEIAAARDACGKITK